MNEPVGCGVSHSIDKQRPETRHYSDQDEMALACSAGAGQDLARTSTEPTRRACRLVSPVDKSR